jgi:modulator of FtsH protease
MLALETYRPDQWHDFFVVVGTGAAALTGLVFVALSLNVNVVTQDATHRYRAIDTLSGMVGVFVICALALMGGQDHRAVGIEWLVVATISICVYLHGYVLAVRLGGSTAWLHIRRMVVLTVLYLAQLVGAAWLVADHIAGLYVAAVAMVAALAFMISGAWLLVVGTATREPDSPLDRSP